MMLCVADGFFLRYTEHVTPTMNTDIIKVPGIKCKCESNFAAESFKSMQPNTGTTAVPPQKFPLAVPMFSSYGWGPQG